MARFFIDKDFLIERQWEVREFDSLDQCLNVLLSELYVSCFVIKRPDQSTFCVGKKKKAAIKSSDWVVEVYMG